MNIIPMQQNNPNFGKLYAPRKLKLAESVRSKDLLKYPVIKECADKFDAVVKREQEIASYREELGCIPAGITGILTAVIGSVVVACTYSIKNGLCCAFPLGIAGGLLGGLITPFIPDPERKEYLYSITGVKKYHDGSEIKTQPYAFSKSSELDFFGEESLMVQHLEKQDKAHFLTVIAKHYPENGVFDAKSILKILESKDVKQDYKNGEAFNYSIDINDDTTLLSKFFELFRTEANAKDYDKIVSIIKSTPNIDFNQKDNVGISIAENILNSENISALDVIKDVEVEYSDTMDTLYNNIRNEEFKRKALDLNVKFTDPAKVLEQTGSLKEFQNSLKQLDSPFYKNKRVAIAKVWETLSMRLQNTNGTLREVNRILFDYLPENLRMDV